MRRQRGALNAQLSMSLAVSALLLVTIVPPIHRAASNYRAALDIQASVRAIVHQSRTHYAEQVLTSRCLAQTDLSMNALSLPSGQAGADYQVSYQQNAQANTRPSGIDVTVTLTAPGLQGSAAWLFADRQQDNVLTFHYPLNYQLPDYQELDTHTGCIR